MEDGVNMDDTERNSLQLQINNLKIVNAELVAEVEKYKLSLKQKNGDYLELQRELNNLKLKLCRIQHSGTAKARALGVAMQSNIGDAMTNLVQASNVLASTLEITKNYIRERQELETSSPRWSNLSSPRTNEKLNKVRPMSVGGHNIQPVVALSRMPLSVNTSQVSMRSPTQNNNRERTALPMHLLQDLYIPLMRIDSSEFLQSNEEEDVNEDDNVEDLELNESHNDLGENMDSIQEDNVMDPGRTLNEIQEDIEPEEEIQTPPRLPIDNPMEGPSWLLDVSSPMRLKSIARMSEPDSTTEHDNPNSPEVIPETPPEPVPQLSMTSRAFTPTVRRRKRPSSPPSTPPSRSPTIQHPSTNRHSKRIPKVIIPKIRVEENAAQDAGNDRQSSQSVDLDDGHDVTESEHIPKVRVEECSTRETGGERLSKQSVNHDDDSNVTRRSRRTRKTSDDTMECSRRSSELQEDARRVRRARKTVVYKEKPLNRKLRR